MISTFGFERNPYRKDVNFNGFYWSENKFTSYELQTIEDMTKRISFEDTLIGTGKDTSDERKSRIKWCPQNAEWAWVYKKLHDVIKEANDTMWKFDLSAMNEPIQYTEYYGTQEGGYEWHMDCGDGTASQRKISVTVQLSDPDEYEGGDLEFNIGQKICRSKKTGCSNYFSIVFFYIE